MIARLQDIGLSNVSVHDSRKVFMIGKTVRGSIAGGCMGTFRISAQSFCILKTSLKNKVYYLKITGKPMRSLTPSNSRHTKERGFPENFPP